MIRVSNHLQKTQCLGSITILRRWLDPLGTYIIYYQLSILYKYAAIPFQEISEWLNTEVTNQISWCLNPIFAPLERWVPPSDPISQAACKFRAGATEAYTPEAGWDPMAMASASASGLYSHQWWISWLFSYQQKSFQKRRRFPNYLHQIVQLGSLSYLNKIKWLYKLLPGQQVAVKFHQLLPLKNTHGCQKIWYALACPPFQ